ncbi:unnamed protein product [Microthlaspi erraticum]|uniref:TF-B3 domain-containing protein n=1 Tax=Microthlaspi erraticum TaxID=1685480 RepID=A0A6D2IH29_9BRAS|nr:unnamed protein product [Microthlaspi erraticum]
MKLKLTSDKTWEVKLDGRRFADGWEDFSTVHCLQDDDVLVFKDKGDMVFHVTPSGRSFFQVHCISSESEEDDIRDDGSDSKNIASKMEPRKETESPSESSYLVAHVTSSNLSRDTLVTTLYSYSFHISRA